MKKTIHLLSLILLVSMTISLSSCGDDDVIVPPTPNCNQGSLTFELNGVQWSASTFNNTLIYGTDPASGYNTRRCDIRATDAAGNQLVLTFTNVDVPDGDCMSTGDYKSISDITSTTDNVILFTYIENGNTTTSATEGTFNLSSCDPNNNRQMEGTFTFDSSNSSANSLIGTNGQFSICI